MEEIKDPQPAPICVPVQIASNQTEAWRNFMATLPAQDQINAYFIPIGDITSILQFAKQGIRVYFAMRPVGQGANQQVHLYVVPVDEQGNDQLENPQTADPSDTLIYDTTMPCPNMCGAPNALNTTLPQKP